MAEELSGSEQNSDNLVPSVPGYAPVRYTHITFQWWRMGLEQYTRGKLFPGSCYENLTDTLDAGIYIAEVKFFKAILYFEMLKTFGDRSLVQPCTGYRVP